MNRRSLLKSSLPFIGAGYVNNVLATPPKFTRVKLKKNVVLVTVNLGLCHPFYRDGKNECRYFREYFSDFKDEVTYFNDLSMPGIGVGHETEHAVFTCLRYEQRDKHPNMPFISLDQHLAEYSKQETRHKSIFHKVTGGGRTASFNSLAQQTPHYGDLMSLHNNLFGSVDLVEVKKKISKQRFILKELYNNTKRRWRGSQEEKDMIASIDYKIDEIDERVKWLKVRKPIMAPKFDWNALQKSPVANAHEDFKTIFHALEKEQTRVALVQFGGARMTQGLPGVSERHHALSHHGYYSSDMEELARVDHFVLKSLQSFIQQLKDSKLLDDTIVLFSSSLSCAERHSTKNIPAFLFGGGFKHQKVVECKDSSGNQVIDPRHLYSSILKQAGFTDPSFAGNKKTIDSIL